MEGTDLDLPKGTSHIDGETALRLVRARHIYGGLGTDLERIDRQHLFLDDVIREASSSGLITDPVRLYDVLSKIAASLTVDKGLSGDGLKTFLLSLQTLKPSDIKFFTVPWKANSDGATISWVTAKADVMWSAMIHDTAYPPASSSSSNPSAKPSVSHSSSASPSSSAAAAAAAGTCFS